MFLKLNCFLKGKENKIKYNAINLSIKKLTKRFISFLFSVNFYFKYKLINLICRFNISLI
jgi:hypothetical protein